MASNEVGAFLPLNYVWDPESIKKMDVNSSDFKELIIRLYQNTGNITQAVNNKDTGIYDTSEFVTGATFYPNVNPIAGAPQDRRQVYRSVVNFGALPNAAIKKVEHHIPLNKASSVVKFYGGTTKPAAPPNLWFLPLPYVDAAGANISLYADDTYIYIDTLATNYSAYTISYVIIEYLKQ
jgi:hypothetical protein